MFRVPAVLTSGPVILVFTLASGLAGGVLFSFFRMPLPWMLGAMFVVTILALSGAKVRVQGSIREPMVVVMGVMLGSAFTPDIFDQAERYAMTLALVAVYITAVAAACIAYLRYFGGYDLVTAYFSGIPGGLLEMMLIGTEMGGDERKIFLTHGTRVFMVVFLIPFWFRFVEGYVPPPGISMPMGTPFLSIAGADLVVLAICGIVGLLLGRLLHFPAPRFTGPLLLSAIAHLAGFSASKPPSEAIIAAQLVLGSGIGARYVGVRLGEVMGTVRIAAGSTLIMLAAAVLTAVTVDQMLGVSSQTLLLTLTPGGFVEMTLIALALGIDVVFVTTHHLVRMMMAIFVAPLAFRLLRRKTKTGPSP